MRIGDMGWRNVNYTGGTWGVALDQATASVIPRAASLETKLPTFFHFKQITYFPGRTSFRVQGRRRLQKSSDLKLEAVPEPLQLRSGHASVFPMMAQVRLRTTIFTGRFEPLAPLQARLLQMMRHRGVLHPAEFEAGFP